MQLTMLGTSGAYPRAGGACSGYLIEEGITRLLIDCGTGVISNLQQYIPLWDVSHIVISHLHADPFLDLFPFRYALSRLGRGHPYLHLPPDGEETLSRITSILDLPMNFFSDFFQVAEYDPEATLQVGDLIIKFARVKHYIPTYAMAISGTRRIVYSADSGPCNELEELARDADLFLCEAAGCGTDDGSLWGHLSPQEAAEMARRAGAKKLVLTHFWPECDYSGGLKLATDAFDGEVEVAEEHRTYIV